MTPADTIAAERLVLADRLSGLPEDDWETPSLCGGWTVRHVLAHLVTPFLVTPLQLGRYAVRGRGVPGAMDLAARDICTRHDVAAMLDVLRTNADSTFRPPGMPIEAPLTDIVCHAADIRWPLGDPTDDWGDPERLRPTLDFLLGRRAQLAFVPRGRFSGVRLVATDQDWSHGDGPEIRGHSLALAMGMLGRPPAAAVLSGEGIGHLFD